MFMGFPGGSVKKNPPINAGDAGDMGSIHGFGKSPEEGNGKPLQYSCLENPTDGGTWYATVYRVTKSRTRLSDFSLEEACTVLVHVDIFAIILNKSSL